MELLETGIAQLGIKLPENGIEQLMCYLTELLRWNKKINLTSLDSAQDIIIKHFIDSLTSLPFLETSPGAKWMDVGTGGGFPGLVLKIAVPEIELTLVEPSGKKVTFLHHLIGLFGMRNVSVINERIESFPCSEKKGRYDLVMTRALSPDLLLENAPDLVCEEGKIVIFQGYANRASWEERINKYAGLRLEKIRPVHLPFSKAERTLIFIEKI